VQRCWFPTTSPIAGRIPVGALAKELPRYRSKLLLRKLLDFAPPNGLINALLMTGGRPRRWRSGCTFHTRAGSSESYEAWAAEFEKGELSQTPPQVQTPKLRLI